jgi:hypothetical protein
MDVMKYVERKYSYYHIQFVIVQFESIHTEQKKTQSIEIYLFDKEFLL